MARYNSRVIVPRTPPDRDAVSTHYDELDLQYREIWGEHVHHGLWDGDAVAPEVAARRLTLLVAQRAGVAPGSSVCDIGCGYGASARLLAECFGARVTAITLSRRQYEQACDARVRGPRPRYLCADWLTNDLPSESFDVALAIESTEHMADLGRCFAEAERVLRPGGRLAVCAWLAADQPGRWAERHLLEPICREGQLWQMGRQADYGEALEAAGFAAPAFEDLSARVKRTWPVCIRRGLRLLWRDRRHRRCLLSRRSRHRVFALTLFRVWLAYETGSMRYGLYVAAKPGI